MTGHLTGKHALVTGGGTGIGLAVAKALADQGATVSISGRRFDVLQDALSGSPNIHPVVMDVRNETSVVDGVDLCVRQRGPIAICVANAGIARGQALRKTSLETWRQTMATNLDGAFLTIRECLKTMHDAEWGRVIAISSIAGIKGLKGAPAYTASKHGMIGLIRALSEDYLGSGLTFNALCPAYVDTSIVEQNIESISMRAGIDAKAARDIMVNTNRHKRLIEPSEVAAAAMWLCGSGSGSVNGQAIEISGGQI